MRRCAMVMRAAKRRKKSGMAFSANRTGSTTQGIVDVQVLGTGANGISPSLLLRTNQGHYLFNAGDGLQRFCVQHKLRMGRIQGMFLTSLRCENTGGVPGALLTMADIANAARESSEGAREKSCIDIHGPPGTGYFINSMFDFYARPSFGLEVTEHASFEKSSSKSIPGMNCLQAIALKHRDAPPAFKPGDTDSSSASSQNSALHSRRVEDRRLNLAVNFKSEQSQGNELRFQKEAQSRHFDPFKPARPLRQFDDQLPTPTDDVVCYVCQTLNITGKFDAEKAAALGVNGRDRGRLVRGEGPITLHDGTVVNRSDVMADDLPGASFAVIDCPTLDYVDSLLSQEELFHTSSDKQSASRGFTGPIGTVFHFAPAAVLLSREYTEFMTGFPKSTLHVIQNATHCPPLDAMISGQRNNLLLCNLHHKVFPSPILELKELSMKSKMTSESTPHLKMGIPGIPAEKCSVAQTKGTLRLVPATPEPFLNMSEVPPLIDPLALYDEAYRANLFSTDCIERLREAERLCKNVEKLNPSIQDLQDEDPEITFLGTGSAVPSKYRNVTGIALRMKSGSMLIDPGEGTYQQLERHFYCQVDSKHKLEQFLMDLKLIWISHKHADHHLGIGLLLAMLPDVGPPKTIVCPTSIINWLSNLIQVDKRLRGRFVCVPCSQTAISFPPPGADKAYRRRPLNQVTLEGADLSQSMADLGLTHLESVSVNHCRFAYGLVLKHRSGWSLAYSGDTRPDERLWTAGKGVDVLIHEATFDSDMIDDARAKRHSTVAEAIDVGNKMQAKHIILTHFSQRYPKLPSLGDSFDSKPPEKASEGAEEASTVTPTSAVVCEKKRNGNVTVAFDFMCVRLSDLCWTPALLPSLRLLFPSENSD